MASHAPEQTASGRDMAGYYRRLEQANLAPLWESLAVLAPHEPVPRAAPFVWRYGEVREQLLEAGRLITAEEAERRVVVLANPGLPGRHQITDTLYAGLQLILPGESAPPHRHTQTALRFVMEGKGAYTAVNGERAEMRPGDFIVTPAWTWHEHGHDGDGDEPVIWMDGLDVPLVGFLHAGFREDGPPTAPGPTGPTAGPPAFAYPYDRSREALEQLERASAPDPCHGFRLDYADAMPTIGAGLRLLPKGFSTCPYRSTDGVVMTVVEGSVTAVVGSEAFRLGSRDTICLPGWTAYRLEAPDDCVLFAFSDRPVHQALGLWREQRGQ